MNFDDKFALSPIKFRILAFFIDGVIFTLYAYFAGISFGSENHDSEGRITGYSFRGIYMLLFSLGILLLFPVLEGFTGKTIGKRIVGIEVVNKRTQKHSLLGSFIRHLFSFLDIFFFFMGYIIAENNRNKQRIGDMVANTIVIKKRRLF